MTRYSRYMDNNSLHLGSCLSQPCMHAVPALAVISTDAAPGSSSVGSVVHLAVSF